MLIRTTTNPSEASVHDVSVIIATLQRSPDLAAIVEQCAAHPDVLEVILVNNAPEGLDFGAPHVRVLQQETNIFVNPAWNLGAREARGALLAIINDDVRFGDDALAHAAEVLRQGHYAIVSADPSCFRRAGRVRRRTGHRFARFGNHYFGNFMCMRAEDYVPIPEEMLIWGGDDWLFLNQRKPNAVLVNTRFVTTMGTTTQAPEFKAMRQREQAVADRILIPLRGTQDWHVRALRLERRALRRQAPSALARRTARRARQRVRRMLRRMLRR